MAAHQRFNNYANQLGQAQTSPPIAPPKFKVGDRVQCTPVRHPDPAGGNGTSIGWSAGREFVINEITNSYSPVSMSFQTYVYWPLDDPDHGVFELDLEADPVTNQGELPVNDKPYKKLLKSDIEVGMNFVVTTQLHLGARPIPKDTQAAVIAVTSNGVEMEFSGWDGGNALGGKLDGANGFILSMEIINSYLRPAASNKIDFDSVILEETKKNQIIHALKQVDFYSLIFETWGFGKTFEKGKGISMLFYGPPGTGKTLMAQAIAHKLDYSLKIISNADIQSSVPGEAERNIRKYFKDNKGAKSILLFDECDSLIHSRASVGAIIGAQINELLSQLERFEGITVFTTNRLGSLDEAVNRRLSIKVEFAMPTLDERVKIWQRMFPPEAPLDGDVNWRKLAKFEIAGGHIKNAVLRAAREAASAEGEDRAKTITMAHLNKGLAEEVKANQEFNKAKHQWEGRYRYSSPGGDLEAGSGELKLSAKQDLKMMRKSVQEMRGGRR